MYMPSPYNALVRNFLRALENGEYDEPKLSSMLATDAVLHTPHGADGTVDHTGAAAAAAYLDGLRKASGGTLALKPQSFELRDRGAVSLLEVSGSAGGEGFTELVRLVVGLAGGRVQEVWIDPADRESFQRRFGG